MALWILGQPAEMTNAGEMAVADHLSRLNDDWVICWGFRYGPEGGTDTEREGDFLIQGPTGHIAVIEVKAGKLRQFALTGFWEHAHGDNPAVQLLDELNGVLRRLRRVCGAPHPLVHHALALPNVTLVQGDRFLGQLSRANLIEQGDLEKFGEWWTQHVRSRHLSVPAPAARDMFMRTFASGATPKAMRFFVNETDKLILRQLEAESGVLDLVAGNRQLLVAGGCGCGKTFLALEQARRWAEQGAGRRVLLLCYNLPLAEQLRQLAERRRPARGEIVVHSWESIAAECLASASIALQAPEEFNARRAYYSVEVPGYLLTLLDDGALSPAFDALVVDEGQDHDTRLPAVLGRPELPGWWAFYRALLREGAAAQVAVFYDQAQRPRFRAAEDFQPTALATAFSQPAWVRLERSLRYTRPVFQFLAALRRADGTGHGERLRPPPEFREGPEVVVTSATPANTANVVAKIISQWVTQGLCHPHDILVIGRRRSRVQSSLGDVAKLGDYALVDLPLTGATEPKTVPYLNVHRAKGLERLAVIVIDQPAWADMAQRNEEEGLDTYFAAVSRARQLLAVVHREDPAA
jgi:hypothetical protein